MLRKINGVTGKVTMIPTPTMSTHNTKVERKSWPEVKSVDFLKGYHEAMCDADEILHQELQKAVESERKEWIAGNRCRLCGGENLDSKGLSDVCIKCYEEQ